jgi:hypothetical protein
LWNLFCIIKLILRLVTQERLTGKSIETQTRFRYNTLLVY